MRSTRVATSLFLLVLSACATPRAGGRHIHPPLTGKVWDVAAHRFISWEALEARARAADFVVLGETHDNPDHHLLQARLVRAVASAQRHPSVAFEMLDVEQQPIVDAARRDHPTDPDALAAAVDWAHSGWPAFPMYRPIFAAAMELELPIVAANLSRQRARRVMEAGASAADPAIQARLHREEPLPAARMDALREEMRTSHCGALPETLIDPMVLAQRARNVQLALRLEQADRGDGAILITGAGHARTDRAVPRLVSEDRPQATVLAVGFLEVDPERMAPDDYARAFGAEVLPFDVVVFTPEGATPSTSRAGRSAPLPCRGR
ncbi:MAG: ChaN family lipoprotein [Myxococcaceae bacterium]|nr:ChaN family lipoprotein [Myxococcaceae bacterium]